MSLDSLKQQIERKRKQMEYGVKVLHNRYSEGYTKAIDDVVELVGALEKTLQHKGKTYEDLQKMEQQIINLETRNRVDADRQKTALFVKFHEIKWVRLSDVVGDEK